MKLLPLERVSRRLDVVNRLMLPFLRASRRQAGLSRLLGENLNPAMVVSSRDYTVTVLVYTMPTGPHLVVALYASTQSSRPLSPKQLAARLARLRDAVLRLRGRYFNQADVVYLVYAPAGFTRGARRLAVRQGIAISCTTRALLTNLARYIKTRYERLRRKLEGKTVWGRVPLLLYMLGYMARELGAAVELPDLAKTIETIERRVPRKA